MAEGSKMTQVILYVAGAGKAVKAATLLCWIVGAVSIIAVMIALSLLAMIVLMREVCGWEEK
jgi:hypothetical protein